MYSLKKEIQPFTTQTTRLCLCLGQVLLIFEFVYASINLVFLPPKKAPIGRHSFYRAISATNTRGHVAKSNVEHNRHGLCVNIRLEAGDTL